MRKRVVALLIFFSFMNNAVFGNSFLQSFFSIEKAAGFISLFVLSTFSDVKKKIDNDARKTLKPRFLIEKRFCELTADEKNFVENLIAERSEGTLIEVVRQPIERPLQPCSFMWESDGRSLKKKVCCAVYPSSIMMVHEGSDGLRIVKKNMYSKPCLADLIAANYIDIPLCKALELRKLLEQNSESFLGIKDALDACIVYHKACLTHEIGHCIDANKNSYRYTGEMIEYSMLATTLVGYSAYVWLTRNTNYSFFKELFRSMGVAVSLSAINKGIAKYFYNAREYAADDYVMDEREMQALKYSFLVDRAKHRLRLSKMLQNAFDHVPGGWYLYDTLLDFEHPTCEQRIARIDRRLQEMGCEDASN